LKMRAPPKANRKSRTVRGFGDEQIADSELTVPAPLDPVSLFLLKTLISKPAIYRRAEISYVAARKWRTPIKAYQIEALKALKTEPPTAFVDAVAEEILLEIAHFGGFGLVRSVVPVPCGSSGKERCLSVLVAATVAKRLGVAFCNVLQSGPVARGSSSPRKSAKLAPFKVNGALMGPALVIDDVITSGRHMELAQKALRLFGVPVLGIGWIGPS
jgi:hypothetical protein